jgi:Kef-type K+ transport system membrane component KefB
MVLFLGLSIAITALPVSVRILMDLGKLQTDVGQKIISAAIFNDIITLFILGVILDFNTGIQSYKQLAIMISTTIIKFMIFLGLVIFTYRMIRKSAERMTIINKALNRFLGLLKTKESLFALLMVFILAFAGIAQALGLHFVVGAFFSSLLISRDILGEENFNQARKTTSSITYGLLAPVFFGMIGLSFSLSAINNIPLLFIVVITAFISKTTGGFLGGKMARLNTPDSLSLGLGLNVHGIMELVVVTIALESGFIDHGLFTILVIMGITTTLVSPMLLKRSFAWADKRNGRLNVDENHPPAGTSDNW